MLNGMYKLIGQAADVQPALLDFGASGKVDTDLFSAPTGDATWTKYTDNTTTAAETVMEDAGYVSAKINGTSYRIPLYTAT
jgi:hypothetical protein